MKKAHFSRNLFGFLEKLRSNNRREWFEANRTRYERDVREPMLAFISDFAPRLRKISPKLVADPCPSGGSMFRIHRDVRFSPDKRPYKTHVAARFWRSTLLELGPICGFHFPSDCARGGSQTQESDAD
jgi:uncharacterized protein (TIGR02453 family)